MPLPDVVIYATGLVMSSVCAPSEMPVADVEDAVNRLSPTGISSRWSLADEAFASGEPNPTPCNDDPARQHHLLNC